MAKVQIWGASYERGRQLVEVGCPLLYLKHLPRSCGRSLFVAPLRGYYPSRAISCGILTKYVIGFSLRTPVSAVSIADWNITLPWPGHHVDFDSDPEDVVGPAQKSAPPGKGIPPTEQQQWPYLFDGRLLAVLNEHQLLRRGRAIEGVVCGMAGQPVPSADDNEPVFAHVTVITDSGEIATARVPIEVDRSFERRRRKHGPRVSRLNLSPNPETTVPPETAPAEVAAESVTVTSPASAQLEVDAELAVQRDVPLADGALTEPSRSA